MQCCKRLNQPAVATCDTVTCNPKYWEPMVPTPSDTKCAAKTGLAAKTCKVKECCTATVKHCDSVKCMTPTKYRPFVWVLIENAGTTLCDLKDSGVYECKWSTCCIETGVPN